MSYLLVPYKLRRAITIVGVGMWVVILLTIVGPLDGLAAIGRSLGMKSNRRNRD